MTLFNYFLYNFIYKNQAFLIGFEKEKIIDLNMEGGKKSF